MFSTVSYSYAKLYPSGSLWVDEFQMIELDEIMRQHGDSEFCELLCRIRTADHTDGDLLSWSLEKLPHNDVNDRNSHMLNALVPKSQQYSIKACDSMAGQTDYQTCLTNDQRLVAFTVSLK